MIRFEGLKDIPTTPQAWAGYALGRQVRMMRALATVAATAPQRQLHVAQALLKAQQEWISGLPGLSAGVEEAAAASPAPVKKTAAVRKPAVRKPAARKAAPKAPPAKGAAAQDPAKKTSAKKTAAKPTPAKTSQAKTTQAKTTQAKTTRAKPARAKTAPAKQLPEAKVTTSANAETSAAPSQSTSVAQAVAVTGSETPIGASKDSQAPARRRPRAPSAPPNMPDTEAGKGGTKSET